MVVLAASQNLNPKTAFEICLVFGAASLLSIGGGNSVVPEIQFQSITTYHWLTSNQFADLFAIAQAAPGPSMLLVTLVGFRAAGIGGALLATAAMILPAGMIVCTLARVWQAHERSRWHAAIQHGLAPVGVGLVAASGLVIARTADSSIGQSALTALATVVLCTTRINPLILVAVGALVGWMNWV